MEPLQLVTLVVAIAGFLLGAVSVGWQIYSWRASGSSVTVETNQVTIYYNDSSSKPAVQVIARNKGRIGVDITAWAFSLPDEHQWVINNPAEWVGPAVPIRLDAGQRATWQIESETLREALEKFGYPAHSLIRGRVSLGTGEAVISKEGIELPTK